MKKILIILLTLLLLSGCVSQANNGPDNETEPNDDKQVLSYVQEGYNYQVIIPFEKSDLRLYHGSLNRNDRVEVGRRLQELSAKHFNPDDYFISEGRVISSDLHNKLIKYSSIFDEGLNPDKEQAFTTTDGSTVVGPVIVTDIIEMDFYKSTSSDAVVEGITVAITLNKFTTMPDGSVKELAEETMIDFGESAGRKLVSIIRSQAQMTNVPIFVALYSLESSDSALPGGYVSSAFFEGRAGQFTDIKEEWILFPSSRANTVVNQFAVEFDLYRQSLSTLIESEMTGVIGMGRLVDNRLDVLQIEINTQGKTFLEVQALTQYAASLLDRFKNFGLDITIQVKIYDKVVAVVSQGATEKEATIIYV